VPLLLQKSSDDSGSSSRQDLSESDLPECSEMHSLRNRHYSLPRVVTRQQFAGLRKLDIMTTELEVILDFCFSCTSFCVLYTGSENLFTHQCHDVCDPLKEELVSGVLPIAFFFLILLRH